MKSAKTTCVLTKETLKKLTQIKLDNDFKSLDDVIKSLIEKNKNDKKN